MSERLRFSIVTTNQEWLRPHVTELDATGFDALYVVDHPAFPIGDPWTWLAFAAARTERIRLGTHVTGAPFHHPTQLAKQVATVDVLSGGRAVLGIGTGYEYQDFEPYGFRMLPFNERLSALGEMLQILRQFWTGESTQFHGAHYTLEGGADFEPKPVQQPHPPIIVGLNRQGRALRMAAEMANGINTWQLDPDQIDDLRPHIQKACERANRDPGELRLTADVLLARGADRAGATKLAETVSGMARSWGRSEKVTDWGAGGILYGDAEQIAEQAARFEEAGVCELSVSFHDIENLRWFDENVLSRFRARGS